MASDKRICGLWLKGAFRCSFRKLVIIFVLSPLVLYVCLREIVYIKLACAEVSC